MFRKWLQSADFVLVVVPRLLLNSYIEHEDEYEKNRIRSPAYTLYTLQSCLAPETMGSQ